MIFLNFLKEIVIALHSFSIVVLFSSTLVEQMQLPDIPCFPIASLLPVLLCNWCWISQGFLL